MCCTAFFQSLWVELLTSTQQTASPSAFLALLLSGIPEIKCSPHRTYSSRYKMPWDIPPQHATYDQWVMFTSQAKTTNICTETMAFVASHGLQFRASFLSEHWNHRTKSPPPRSGSPASFAYPSFLHHDTGTWYSLKKCRVIVRV